MAGLDSLAWKPFQEAHSIEMVAAQVNFSEQLTEMAWKRVVRDVEGSAKAAGLVEKSNLQGIEITINEGQGLPQGLPTALTGVRFMRTTAIETAVGLQRKFQEALTINRTGLLLQSAVYSRWEAFADRINLLMRPALRGALHSVSVSNVRLEYKDAFRYEGEGPPIARTLLNESSNLIAPHVLDNEKLWHSHTGFFEDAPGCEQRLIQVNIDANQAFDQLRPEASFRAVSITTAVQNNFATGAQEPVDNLEELATSQLTMFESLHDRAIQIFTNLVHPLIAQRVGIE